MKERRKIVCLVLGLAVATVAGAGAYWVATAPQRVAAAQSPLAVDPAALDFGEVWEDSAFTWTLPIENHSDAAVRIRDVTASCNCLAVEPRSFVVPAGGKTEVRLTLNLTGPVAAKADAVTAVRDFALPLAALRQDDASAPKIWVLRGRVRTAAVVSPPLVQLGQWVRGQTVPPQSATVTLKTPVKALEAACDPALASVRVTRSRTNSEAFVVTIVPRQTIPSGPFNFPVKIRLVVREGKKMPRIVLPVAGVMLEDIQARPTVVAFGIVPLGRRVEQTVVLGSAAGKKLQVRSVRRSSDDIEVEPAESATHVKSAYRISQRASRLGDQSGEVRFAVGADGTKATVEVVLPVTYHGTQEKKAPEGR